MAFLLGEKVQIGVGVEETRGTAVTPQIWVPTKEPDSIHVMADKVLVRETRASGINSQGSEIVQRRAEGEIVTNLRALNIGFFLKSLFGGVQSGGVMAQSGAYDHVFTVDNDPQRPTLTIAKHQGADHQHYKVPLAVVSSIDIEHPLDDLVAATIGIIAKDEEEVTDYGTPSLATGDDYFRAFDVTVKVADTVANLGAASVLATKAFKLSLKNNARPNQNLNNYNPSDILALLFEAGGDLELDYVDETFRDHYAAGDYLAMQLRMVRSDLTIGSSTNPALTFVFPKVSFESYDPDRPIDDILRDKLNFVAHYDDTEEYAVEATLRNTLADYAAETS